MVITNRFRALFARQLVHEHNNALAAKRDLPDLNAGGGFTLVLWLDLAKLEQAVQSIKSVGSDVQSGSAGDKVVDVVPGRGYDVSYVVKDYCVDHTATCATTSAIKNHNHSHVQDNASTLSTCSSGYARLTIFPELQSHKQTA